MCRLTDNVVLYHGSYCEVKNPDLKRCARHKDFGRGFYLTTSRTQAENFAGISIRKAAFNGLISKKQRYGIVSVFQFEHKGNLAIKEYATADADWLHCVAAHRKNGIFPEVVQELKKFDIITGKVANDNTNATITAYMAGVFGETGSSSADNMCISLLLPERLQDQLCFRTTAALNQLTFVESGRIWI